MTTETAENRFDRLATNMGLLEMQLAFQYSFLANYKELTYDLTGLTLIEIWDTPSKGTKLFNKALTYSDNNLTQIVLTRISDGKVLTKNFTYEDGNLISVTSVT